MSYGDQSYANAIDDHYTRAWGAPLQVTRWNRGPAEDLSADFRVLVIQRSARSLVFATRCMSQMTDSERLELHILARQYADRDELVELLTAVAHYLRTGHPLGLAHTVNFGRPWLPGSTCSFGLVSLPYLDGATLEWLDLPEVRFLWLVPITEAELSFKKKRGVDALERRFEAARFDYQDPLRQSVV